MKQNQLYSPNCTCSFFPIKSILVKGEGSPIAIGGITMVVTLCIVLIPLSIYKLHKKRVKARNVVTQDLNPVYGHYYSSEGVRLDQSTVEVRDQNDLYYEQQYEN